MLLRRPTMDFTRRIASPRPSPGTASKRIWRAFSSLGLLLGICLVVGTMLSSTITPTSQTLLFPAIGKGGVAVPSSPQLGIPGRTQTPTTSTPQVGFDVKQWAIDGFKGLVRYMLHGIANTLEGLVTWAESWGVINATPKDLTYEHDTVKKLHAWSVGVLDAALALFLTIGGYTYMLGGYRDFRQIAVRLLIAVIAANFSLFYIPQVIELQNALTSSLQTLFGSKVNLLPTGTIDTSSGSTALRIVCFYLAELVMSIMILSQRFVYLALLDFLIVLAPLGIACFTLPQTQEWGNWWMQLFVSTLLMPILQNLCLYLSSTILAATGPKGVSVVGMLIGIGGLYLAFKLPTMLVSKPLGLLMNGVPDGVSIGVAGAQAVQGAAEDTGEAIAKVAILAA
ncbi:hypothetical protein [Ktedonospora formicarum]|uniref:TrbL/VirB6 plasmid conjugal transfer protein n=1 Tax=Ktedonospora formicarum TaxID=2778364 RepID=A0A8J3I4D1_9CHLR|nr:hypothetical protein [Ktedonospora formicarum]GHO49184.1 hypothetical protein KSX_73470 [Ktedonospora formicarum]